MTTRTLSARLAVLAAGLGLLAGCGGGPRLVDVSGVVTLDGKPYPNAVVSFQPVGDKENPNPGGGSMGLTDSSGKYMLKYDHTTYGAVAGKHRVRISTLPGKGARKVTELGTEDGIVQPKGAAPVMDYDEFPTSWNENSQHTFDVPSGGTDKANFDAGSDKKQAKKK